MLDSHPTISIFDIILIVDAVCQSLSLRDIQFCRRVNRQWAFMFKPHLLNAVKLSSTLTLTDNILDFLLESKCWIRSLTVAAPHIIKLASLSLATLQELVFCDDHFEQTHNDQVQVESVVALIDNNSGLFRLEIDLSNKQYSPCPLSLPIMLAIARHRSLTQLTWRVPDGHVDAKFIKHLLYVCHKSIQELVVIGRRNTEPCDFDGNNNSSNNNGCGCRGWHVYHCDPFSLNDDHLHGNEPECRDFNDRVEWPIDQWGSFALRKLSLPPLFDLFALALVRNCPELQYIDIHMSHESSTAILNVLAVSCPELRGLGFKSTLHDVNYSTELGRFQQLQRVYIPSMSDADQVERIVGTLAKSSRESLEVLGVHMKAVTAQDVASIIVTFQRLKKIDFGTVRIYVGNKDEGSTSPRHTQKSHDKDRDFEETIIQRWDPSQMHRPLGTIRDWWNHWSEAKDFMKEVMACVHEQQSQSSIQPVYMKFMYPIAAFVSREEAQAFSARSGPWANDRRSWTLEDARRIMDNQNSRDRTIGRTSSKNESVIAKITKTISDWRK
ncbi:MAG: hypothetical protein BYD32DRAFT_417506 [Podila humilis]|nr:MAG: hypothetical protein BYD32DRAFT_417506 [Podila humilis]